VDILFCGSEVNILKVEVESDNFGDEIEDGTIEVLVGIFEGFDIIIEVFFYVI
jgi:hypothetical protein